MVIFAIFLLVALAASVADIETTLAALKLPNTSEANTFLYGSHPSATRLYVVNAIVLVVCTVIGMFALHYSAAFESCVLFGILTGVHAFGAVSNWLAIRKHG